MGKMEKNICLIVLVIILILLAVLFRRLHSSDKIASTYEVAVIMDNSSEEYWRYFKLGAEKAGADNNMDLRFVGMYLDMEEEGQLSYMEREIANDVDAIIISPINSSALEKWLEEKKITIPVITVGGKVSSQKVINHISADDYSMGESLAEAVAKDNPKSTCTIVYPNGTVEEPIAKRYKGLIDKLEELNITYERYDMSKESLGYGDIYLSYIQDSENVIGLTSRITEQLSSFVGAEKKVYGIGITDEILAGLEKGTIRRIVAHSQYDAGYISINWINSYLKNKTVEDMLLEVYEVDKNNMFTKPLEQILFPIS